MNITSKSFIKARIDKVARIAGPRYEKKVNVDVPVRGLFHAVVKSEKFDEKISELAYEFLEAGQYVGREPFRKLAKDKYDLLMTQKQLVYRRLVTLLKSKPGVAIRQSSIQKLIDAIGVTRKELTSIVEEAEKNKTLTFEPNKGDSYQGELDALYSLSRAAMSVGQFLSGNEISAFSKKSFILKGEAGIGKTHLLCDFAHEAHRMGHLVYIFLGEEFTAERNPISRMEYLLDTPKARTDSFQLIDAAAAKAGRRAIVLVDAINEAQGETDWDCLNELKKFRNISFVISVRTGYESAVLNRKFIKSMPVYIHPGLDISDLDGVNSFFTHFKVPMPEVPFISPELRNPLFLKIFCKTYSRKKTVRGDVGSTTLFEGYVREQTKHVLKAAGLKKTTLLWNVLVKPIAEWMGENGVERIPETEIFALTEATHPSKGRVLLQEMERYWLLTKVPHYTKSGRRSGYDYRFPYQKFSDHLIVRYLIKNHLNKDNPEKSFLPTEKLGAIIDSKYPYFNDQYGIVEALATQIPEYLHGKELLEVAPEKFKGTQYAAETFLNSLMWRGLEAKNGKLKHFNKKTVLEYVNFYNKNRRILNDPGQILETVISCAHIAGHPLDAFTLHRFLLSHKMPVRDALWQEFLHYRFGSDTVIDRYVHWSSSVLARKIKSQDTLFQTAIVLSWFLASSTRVLRDKSTKALVNLLDGRYDVIIKLFELFKSVDDVYILERIYAVAYGCTLRESHIEKIKPLAEYVYHEQFKDNRPAVHVMIRDYARGIVENYHRYDDEIGFDRKLYTPPYKSTFPDRMPTQDFIDRHYPYSDLVAEDFGSIIGSALSGVGDFGRYVIESNLHNFSAVRLDGNTSASEKDKLEGILDKLTPEQRELVDAAKPVFDFTNLFTRIQEHRKQDSNAFDYITTSPDETKKSAAATKWKLNLALKGLSPNDRKLVRKYCNNEHLQDNSYFDAQRGSRWIIKRVMSLGWSPKLHGEHDRMLRRYNQYGRSPNKQERIGKKYQWQALHEFLAMVADHYYIKSDEVGVYDGAWQLSVRDIDPSCLVDGVSDDKSHATWWSGFSYDNWRLDLPELGWVSMDNDLPNFGELIAREDPHGKSWLNLETFYGSEQQIPYVPKDKKYNFRRREIWAMLKSYIIKQSDLDKFIRWSHDKDFEGRWMPESNSFYSVYLGEFPSSPAFTHMYQPYYGREDWQEVPREKPLFEAVVTDDEYSKESGGYDMSTDDGYTIKLPAKFLFDDMDLRYTKQAGQYVNKDGDIVFMDPRVVNGGTKALLVSQDHMIEHLRSQGYSLVWTVLGEKQVLGNAPGGDRNKWAGRLEFSGSYYLDINTSEIVGGIHLKNFNNR